MKQTTARVIVLGAFVAATAPGWALAAGQSGSMGQQHESQQSQQSRGTETIKGEVLVSGEVLRIDQDEFYIVKDKSGKEVRLFAGDSPKEFQPGDQIEAKVGKNGKVQSIKRVQGSQSSQKGQSSQ